MQSLFLDVTKEQLEHNEKLQSCIALMTPERNTRDKYIRICLQDDSWERLHCTMMQIILEESLHWVLQCNRYRFQTQNMADIMLLRQRLQERMVQIQSQLQGLVYQDITYYCKSEKKVAISSLNLEGYFRFSAKKLKWTIETILQEEYQICKEEWEREEFISLLQFCVAVQPCILDDVYITLGASQFTMVDIWGNDLQQIYLKALPKEEYMDVQMHDLLLSILMTMLPKNIHLFISTEQMKVEQQEKQKNLVCLLQKVFADRLLIENSISFL